VDATTQFRKVLAEEFDRGGIQSRPGSLVHMILPPPTAIRPWENPDEFEISGLAKGLCGRRCRPHLPGYARRRAEMSSASVRCLISYQLAAHPGRRAAPLNRYV